MTHLPLAICILTNEHPRPTSICADLKIHKYPPGARFDPANHRVHTAVHTAVRARYVTIACLRLHSSWAINSLMRLWLKIPRDLATSGSWHRDSTCLVNSIQPSPDLSLKSSTENSKSGRSPPASRVTRKERKKGLPRYHDSFCKENI